MCSWNIPDVSPELADLLTQGRLLSLHHGLRTWSKVLRKPYLSIFLRMGLLPCLPEMIRARYQPKVKVPHWIDPDFANQMQLSKRLLPPNDPYGFRKPGRRIQSSLLRQLVWLLASGSYQERDGIEMRSPFLHQGLVEFLFLVPFEQKLRPGEMRSLMRRTLRNVLPEKIWNRPGKGEISEAMKRGWFRERARLKEFLTDSQVVSLGYVNANALERAFTMAIHGAKVDVGALNKTVGFEIWLRSIERYGVSAAGAHQQSECVSSQPSLRYRAGAVAQ